MTAMQWIWEVNNSMTRKQDWSS